jgi:hypothetical protein
VLDKGQCLQGNIHYNGDYKNYTSIENINTETNTDPDTERGKWKNMSSYLNRYGLPISVFLFIFGTTGNVILIITIITNKDMRTVPNMYILNLAVSDMIYLTILFYAVCAKVIPDIGLRDDIKCACFTFFYRMSVDLSAYSVAVLSIQRYRVTVHPLKVRVSSQPTWRITVATIFGVWFVAALFAIPGAQSRYLCVTSALLWRKSYYQHVAVFHLLVSCVLPLCVIAFSYILTARHLVESSSSLPEHTKIPRMNTRKSTAKVVLGLTVVFLISYVPFHIFETYLHSILDFDIYVAGDVDELSLAYNFSDIMLILHLFLSINSCLNPVSLCCTSLAFRMQFKRYLPCRFITNSPSNNCKRAKNLKF